MPKNNSTVRLQISITVQEQLDEMLTAICIHKFLTKREAIKWAIIEYVTANSIPQVKPPVTNGQAVQV